MAKKKTNQLKHLPDESRLEMDTYSPDQLKNLIVSCEQQQEELALELENNETYQSAISVKSDIEAGQRGVKQIMKAKIKYSLVLLEAKGKV